MFLNLPRLGSVGVMGAAGGGAAADPRALIVILHGQSLNAPRNTTVQATAPSAKFVMATGGAATADFDFVATNALYPSNWADVATDTSFTEGSLQTPLAGLSNTLDDGPWAAVWLGSVAVGARTADTLAKSGPRANVHAMLKRFIQFALDDGYTADQIDVAFYSSHGEADASAGTSEANYLAIATEWYQALQLMTAQALGRPTYVAPIFIDYPLQNNIANTGANDRVIKEAIRQLPAAIENCIDMGAKYQWGGEADRVHAPAQARVQSGEFIGKAINEYFTTGTVLDGALYITGVVLTGSSAVVTFNANIVKDTTQNTGQNLNTALAEDGFEWFDNGSQIGITAVSYSGATATLTLASTPVGTLAQQICRIAVQNCPLAVLAGATNLPGSVVRRNQTGWASIIDPTYTNYVWAIPQTFDAVA